jgi:hypothetical protein
MTPSLLGRWQTRFFLLSTIGVLITLPFSFMRGEGIFFLILFYVFLFGLVWDVIYHCLQKLRWDHDWIGVFQFLAGIGEALFIILLLNNLELDLPGLNPRYFDLGWFTMHYTCVWLGVYVASQTLMKIIFPRWRFRGGKFF